MHFFELITFIIRFLLKKCKTFWVNFIVKTCYEVHKKKNV